MVYNFEDNIPIHGLRLFIQRTYTLYTTFYGTYLPIHGIRLFMQYTYPHMVFDFLCNIPIHGIRLFMQHLPRPGIRLFMQYTYTWYTTFYATYLYMVYDCEHVHNEPGKVHDEVVLVNGRRLSKIASFLGAVGIGGVPVGVPASAAKVV